MLLVNIEAEVPELLSNVGFLRTRAHHPIIIVVMIDDPHNESLVEWIGAGRDLGAGSASSASCPEDRKAHQHQKQNFAAIQTAPPSCSLQPVLNLKLVLFSRMLSSLGIRDVLSVRYPFGVGCRVTERYLIGHQ
jgi:hypothetical protein